MDVESDAQTVVDGLEGPEAVGHELVPEGAVLGVAGVQLGGLDPRGLLDGRVAVLDPILGEPIQPRQLADGIGGVGRLVAGVLPAPEDHAELRAPVAEVVVADDPVSDGREDPRQAVADDRRSQMSDVHRLGDVGRGEVDHDRLGPGGSGQAEAIVSEEVAQGLGDPGVVQADIEEPRAGDLGRAGHGGQVDLAGQLLRKIAGFAPVALASAMQPLAW